MSDDHPTQLEHSPAVDTDGDTAPTTSPRPTGRRVQSIDAFRGLTLILMLLTPFTGAEGDLAVLRHAEWDGMTVADLVFPTFLVGSGISLSLLLRDGFRRDIAIRLVRRLALLVVAGLVYNAYGTVVFGEQPLRFTGVLQTIGISGAIASCVLFASSLGDPRRRPRWLPVAAATAVLLIGYHAVGATRSCVSDAVEGRCSVWFGIDRAVLGETHLYRGGTAGYDPEGIAMTVVATSLVLAGWAAGRWMWTSRDRPLAGVAGLAGASMALLTFGWILDQTVVAMNKRLFTTSFVVFATGAAIAAFTVVHLLVDVLSSRRARPKHRPTVWIAVAFGRNALVVFLLERFLLQTSVLVDIRDTTSRQWLLTQMPGTGAVSDVLLSTLLAVTVGTVVADLHARRRYLVL